MGKLKNILAIYDDSVGSDAVLVRAIVLARACKARLTVARPLGQYPQSRAAIEETRRRLRRIVPSIVQEGVGRVSIEVLVGKPHEEITRQVSKQGADLVIANAHMRHGIKDLFLGTTVNRLMRDCPCAVWIARPGHGSVDSIMAVVDADGSPSPSGPCASAVDAAVSLAQAHQVKLHVVRAWDVSGHEGEMLRSELPDETRRAILEKHEAAHRHALETLLASHSRARIDIEVHVPRGSTTTTVATLAGRLGVGAVVMGVAPRSGLAAALNGNPAEAVFDAVRCGVVVIKPGGSRRPMAVDEAEMAPPIRMRASAAERSGSHGVR